MASKNSGHKARSTNDAASDEPNAAEPNSQDTSQSEIKPGRPRKSAGRERAPSAREQDAAATTSSAEAASGAATNRKRNDPRDCVVVAMGASTGGLDSFRRLLRALPTDSGMAFVLLQHLDPTHESLMADLLMKYVRHP